VKWFTSCAHWVSYDIRGTSRWRRIAPLALIHKGFPLKKIWFSIFAAAFIFCEPGFAQKLVDPNAVAPEFREAAEKRRAEQIRQRECAHKAEVDKVLPRDRIEHINKCLQEASATPATASAHQ
jgi:hypothetical protein